MSSALVTLARFSTLLSWFLVSLYFVCKVVWACALGDAAGPKVKFRSGQGTSYFSGYEVPLIPQGA